MPAKFLNYSDEKAALGFKFYNIGFNGNDVNQTIDQEQKSRLKDLEQKLKTYMANHDFTYADMCKAWKWINANRPDKIRNISITRTHIIVVNIYGSEFTVNRLSLGISENMR